MRLTRARWSMRLVVLLLACAFLAIGAIHKHRVYDDDPFSVEFGMLTFNPISDFQLTIDATFSGVVRKEGKLFSTYDRSQPRGKKACPT